MEFLPLRNLWILSASAKQKKKEKVFFFSTAQLLYILLPSVCRQTKTDIPLIAAAKKLYYIWWNEMKIPPSPLNVLHFRKKEERNNELGPFEDID